MFMRGGGTFCIAYILERYFHVDLATNTILTTRIALLLSEYCKQLLYI